MEEWNLRLAAGDASLLVLGQELAEQDEIPTSVSTAGQTATVTVFVARHWALAEVVAVAALVTAAHLLVEAAPREQESFPPTYSGALRCFRSRSTRSTHPQGARRPC